MSEHKIGIKVTEAIEAHKPTVFDYYGEGFLSYQYDTVAEIIERETGVRELIAALELSQKWLVQCVPVCQIDGPKPLPVIAALLKKYGAE